MLRVSRKLRFAIGAVVDIAHYGGLDPCAAVRSQNAKAFRIVIWSS